MTRHNNDGTPQFTCGHPVIDKLHGLVVAYVEAAGEHQRTHEWYVRAAHELQPVAWTKKIEAAVGDDAALERIRIEYDEKAIGFLGTSLRDRDDDSKTYQASNALHEGIKEAIAFHDAIARYSPDEAYKQLLKAGIVVATAEWDRLRGEHHRDQHDNKPLYERAEKAARAAYVALIGSFERSRAEGGSYPTALVVKGRDILPYLNPDVDLRIAHMVALPDPEGRYPANVALVSIMAALEAGVRGLWDNGFSFRADENGSVNEVQHAARILDAIHGQTCAKLDKAAVAAQDARRIRYETASRRKKMQVQHLQQLRVDAVKAMAAAVAEAEAVNVNPQGPCMATSEWINASVRIINNMLAADLGLRRWGWEVDKLTKEPAKDLSHGAGFRAVEAAFDEAAKRFRPHPISTSNQS